MRTRLALTVLLLVLAAGAPLLAAGKPPLAAGPLLERGIDVFTTPADGSTFYDFAQNPVPAGFFCKRSQPFAGRVAFKGLPLATGSPGQLLGGDTVVERLDDAAFDDAGVARTRLQLRALSLVSLTPLKTACGAYHVYVSLAGPQRVTSMAIHRTEAAGGDFVAPLAVDARLTFVPVKPARTKGAPALQLAGSFTFPPQPLPWTFAADAGAKAIGPALVDTNGDLVPDTAFAGTTSFAAGRSARNLKGLGDPISCCLVCHSNEGKRHCYIPAGCNLFCDM